MKLKALILCSLAFCSAAALASDATRFYNRSNRLGCGTILAVADVNQAPLYDREYEALVGGKGSTADLVGHAVSLNLAGVIEAVAVGLAVDAARGESSDQGSVKPPADGVWKNIKAVRVKMDSGEVMNLPLTGQPTLDPGPKYEEGRRVTVFLLPQYKSIQLSMRGRQPAPDDKTYAGWCSANVAPATAAEAFAASSSLVQADKTSP